MVSRIILSGIDLILAFQIQVLAATLQYLLDKEERRPRSPCSKFLEEMPVFR